MHFVKKIGFTDWESRQLCDGAFVVVDQSTESLPALDRTLKSSLQYSRGSIAASAFRMQIPVFPARHNNGRGTTLSNGHPMKIATH